MVQPSVVRRRQVHSRTKNQTRHLRSIGSWLAPSDPVWVTKPPPEPMPGRIAHVRGRKAKNREPGLPKISEIRFDLADGRELSATAFPKAHMSEPVTAVGVCEIPSGRFGICPICLSRPGDTDEHVPPGGFGGRVMTGTCEDCNNKLGSYTEAAMQDWYDHAVQIQYTVEGDPRPSGRTRAINLATDSGEFVLMPERGGPGDLGHHFQTGRQVTMHMMSPRPEEYRNGLLKNAYLAACLMLRTVPDVPSASEIRAELLAARDAVSRADVVLGPHARSLRVGLTGKPAHPPNLALMRLRSDNNPPRYVLSLAGTVIAHWPFPEVHPLSTQLTSSSRPTTSLSPRTPARADDMDYEKAVDGALKALTKLYQEILADLDEEGGGIGWWSPQVGWKRSALLGEYLLSSCTGTIQAITDASLAIEEFVQQEYADNHWIQSQWAEVDKAGRGGNSYLEAIVRGPQQQRRAHLIEMYRNGALSSLATSLDRLAAVVAIVAGIKVKILRFDWGELNTVASAAARNDNQNTLHGRFADPGTPGRERQNRLLGLALTWPTVGPVDWLPWLLKSRNTATHRAARMGWNVMLGTAARRQGFTELFWRQPEWSDTEAMLRAESEHGFQTLLLPQRPYDVLSGLRESTARLVAALAVEATTLWCDRRRDPALIVQNGGIWPDLDAAEPLNFPGYGEPVKVVAKEVRVNPETARRMKASKILEVDRHLWAE